MDRQARPQGDALELLEHHPDAILVLDRQERVCFANARACTMLGQSRAQLLGRPLVLVGLGPGCADVAITRSDGSRGCAEPRSVDLRWGGQDARLITLHDITELRRTEDDLLQRQAGLAADRQRAAVGQLAGSVAHELNNQLMVLRGHLELLEDAKNPDPELRRRLPVLLASLERLESLGRGVMVLGQPQPGEGGSSPGAEAPQAAVQGPHQPPVTILLAEDEHFLRCMVSEALTACGYRVIDAGDGLEALERARAHRGSIQLLLTDVVMPGMDGARLYEALSQERPGLSVLYMSGYSESDNVLLHRLARQGCYLQKPFSIHLLARKVEQALAQA